MQVVGLDIVIDPHHMRMIHGSEDPRLGLETTWRVLLRRGQYLDRDITVQVAVPARQHQPERARTQFGAQVVAGEQRGYLRLIDDHDATVVMCRRPPATITNSLIHPPA